MSDPVIIVGSGLAGYTTAKEWRKLDADTPLVIVTANAGNFYSKPQLSTAFTMGKTPESLVVFDAEKMAAQLNADILTFSQVSDIDVQAHTININGAPRKYSKLVLAVGGDVMQPQLSGSAVDQVFSVNELLDYARFRESVTEQARVAILGAGLVGCEFANDLANVGYQVSVIAPAKFPLDQLLPEAVAAALQQALSEKGVRWYLERTPITVDTAGDALSVTLSDSTVIEADVVLSAIGIKPKLALALSAGIEVNYGICVDRTLTTNQPDIYAIGDCAEVAGLSLCYVAPILNCARALARTLAGDVTQVQYPAMPVAVKTPACPLVIALPPNHANVNWQLSGEGINLKAECYEGEQLIGFILAGEKAKERAALQKQLPPLLV